MNDLSSKSVLIVDQGLFWPLAQRLKREFGRVGYFCDWKRGFPTAHEFDIGTGFDDVERIAQFWDKVDEFDLICFPDILQGDLQLHLRKCGHLVWGSGKGEELELYRNYFKRMLKAVGLPVQPYRVITGIDGLREYLQQRGDKFVKLSLLRGITETFGVKKFWMSEARIDELEHTLGMRKRTTEFMVEDEIETNIECGIDTICVDGNFPSIAASGVEVKDVAYGAVVQDYADLPEGIQLVNERISPVLAKYQYRNFWSTEIRVAKDGTPYFIDPTCRHPSPAGECEHELWGNLGEMMWHGASGDLVDPVPTAKYAVQAIIFGERAKESWQGIAFPEKYRANVKLYFHCRIDGHDYVIPQTTAKMNEIGSVVATGNTLKEAADKCREIAETIEGDKIHVHTDRIQDVLAEFGDMEKKGMSLKPANI